jgi:Tol biopolymer transport system component
MVYVRIKDGRALSIIAKPLAGGEPITVLDSPGLRATLPGFRVSPNGKWIAYVSDETRKYEIYLARFPKGRGKWQVSSGNATAPAWRRDGKELYYLTVGGELFVTDIGEQGNEAQVGTLKLLFRVNIAPMGTLYEVAPDGQGFIMQFSGEGSREPLNLVTDWVSEARF